MEKLLNRLLEILEKYLPTFMLAFGLGKQSGDKERKELETQLLKEELKRRELENALKVRDENANKSNADIVRDIIKSVGEKGD